MAIEVNKRKRKHKNDGDEAVGVDEVPKKIAKKIKTPKKPQKEQNESPQSNGHDENVDEASTDTKEIGQANKVEGDSEPNENDANAAEDPCHDSGFEPDEKELKFSKDFKMLNFRAKLRGTNFMTELRHLLHLTQSRPKIIAKYIEKRGKPLELAEALERIDKTNVLHVAYLCQALQLVIMEILTNQKSHLESAEHACRYFLKAHGAVLESLLKSSNLQHRRIALKMLTAIVCVEPQLGRQLISSYDILSNVKTIEKLLSHSKYELHVEDTVRKCFIHFVLAYLVDGNTLLIRNILDRPTLICALASGLQYDDHVTVCVVLSTLKKYVLECVSISKTKKIHVFDLECCKHIIRLYDWLGPKAHAAKIGGDKNGAQVTTLQQQQAFVDPQELESVTAAAHEFLVMLLTSRKFGITFDAMAHFRQKHNVIQGKLIGFLFKPWCDARKTDLITKILIACPDLARNTMRNFSGIVNPMRTPQREWTDACNFLTQLIDTIHPSLLGKAIDKITLTDFSYWIKDICLPIEVLMHINGSKILRHLNYDFRVATNLLLLSMFTQYSNYLMAISKREQSKGSNTLRRFKFDILNHILVNFPTMEHILYSLYLTTTQEKDELAKVLQHLEITLDLILIICKEHRTFINKTGTILDYLNMLRPLYAANDDETHNIKLELKAIKTILLLFPKALEPRQELFSSVLKSFIKAFVHGNVEVQRESGVLLRDIFKNTGLFDAGELEIDLWLEALRFFDGETVDLVTTVFIEVLKVTKADVDIPKTADASTNEKNLQKLFENIEQGLSVQAYIETLSISKLMPLIFKGVEIVPPLDKYLETVFLLMFHYYPKPEYVLQLYVTEFKSFRSYMENWLQVDESGGAIKPPNSLVVGKIAAHVPKLQELQSTILVEGGKMFEEFFVGTDDDTFEIDFNGKMHNFSNILKNEGMILIYTQAILFIVAQLVAKQKLQQWQATQAASYLKGLIKIAAQHKGSADTATIETTEADSSILAQLLKYIYSIRINYISDAEIFNATHETNLNYLKFLADVTENCNEIENFALYAANYRLKIVKAVEISMQNIAQTIAQTEKLTVSLRLLQAFRLNAENCIEILNLMGNKLKYSDYFCAKTAQRTFYYELLVLLLQRLTALQNAVDCAEFMHKFSKCYINWLRKLNANEINLEPLEDALQQFLQISHQHITQLGGSKFFDAFFVERKLNKASIKLASLLLERNDNLKVNFLAQLPKNFTKKELIYPLLKIAFQYKFEIEASLLQSIYQEYKNGFMRTIEKPQKAANIYKENVEASIALIEHCMPKSECVDFCNKNFKFDAIELYQMKVINAIYRKALKTLEGESNAKQHCIVFVNFINLQLQMLSVDLKKQTLDYEKIAYIAYFIDEWYAHAQPEAVYDFTKVLNSQQWLNYCKTTLKLGMHVSDEGNAGGDNLELQKADAYNGLLLKLLAYLCGKLYVDFNSETPDVLEPAEPAQLFDLIFTHSKFYDIVLNAQNASQVKTEVLHLLLVLAQKSPTQSLRNEQIPVILGAYQAKLTAADRYALALLQLYEHWDCGLQQYRPFIWGESAIAFYALRAADEERSKLQQQETSIAQVMSLIDRQVCDYTLDNFPIWRKLHAAEQLPELQFSAPALRALSFGANELERRIELQQAPAFNIAELRLCPKREAIFDQCYDPAFFIPLMNMCFAPEAYSHPARPVQNGLLSLVFAALSSQDKDMRLAAGLAQQRYRAHFEGSKFFERPLWIQTYENIQAGLHDLRLNWMKHKRNSGTPRVPYISGLFVAKTFNLTTEPTHLLYKQLTMYLRLKSSFNFQCVPEFNVLFYSPEVEHHNFRQFIVEIIRDGIKSSSDLFLLVTTNTFKVLMGFYGGPMSTLDLNLLILSVFSTCVKIPASTKIMIENVGLLPWLSAIMGTLEFYHFDIIEGLISIINNLWYALKANAAEFHNFQHICSDIHRLLLLLLPHISPRISAASFSKLLNILYKTAQPQHYLAVSAEQLDKVISCAQHNYPTLIYTISSIREYGGRGAESKQQYCQRLFDQELDMVSILALSSLRSYVIGWWQSCQQETDLVTLAETSTVVDDVSATVV